MSCLVCPVLLPLGEQPPWTKCVFVPSRRPVAAMSWAEHRNRTLEGSKHPHCCLALSNAKEKGKTVSQHWGVKGFPAHSKIVPHFLLLNNCSVQKAGLGIHHTQLNHVKSARLSEPTWRISTAQEEHKRSRHTDSDSWNPGHHKSLVKGFLLMKAWFKSPCSIHIHPLLQLYQAGMRRYSSQKRDAERCSGHWWSQVVRGFYSGHLRKGCLALKVIIKAFYIL